MALDAFDGIEGAFGVRGLDVFGAAGDHGGEVAVHAEVVRVGEAADELDVGAHAIAALGADAVFVFSAILLSTIFLLLKDFFPMLLSLVFVG